MTIIYYLPIVLPALLYGIYYYFTRTFNYWKSRGVAGPKPVPFFGNIKDSAMRKKAAGIIFKEIYDEFTNEKVVGIYRMTTPTLLLRDLDVIKHVLIKDFDMFVDRGIELSKEGLGANLFHSDGDTWRVLRNRFTPLFTTGKLKNMLYLMVERGDSFVGFINDIVDQQPEQEVHTLVQKYTISTISACAFGLDVDSIDHQIKTLRKIDKLIFSLNYCAELDMMYPGVLKKLNINLFPRFLKQFFHEVVKNVIKQRNGVPSNRNDFMDLILELRQQGNIKSTKRNTEDVLSLEITDDIISAQAFSFYAAGYETSATTMAFLLYEMAKHPDIQDKLVEDIDRLLIKYNGNVTYEVISELTYLDRIVAETLRIYSIGDPLQRNARADYKIPGTNVIVKKGQRILVSVLSIHHDATYYPDPERFDPDRFLAENSKDRHSCAYMPFGIGPRNCIGSRFAKFQTAVCMVKFFSKFRVEVSKNTPNVIIIDPTRLVQAPLGGIPLNIIKRQQ